MENDILTYIFYLFLIYYFNSLDHPFYFF